MTTRRPARVPIKRLLREADSLDTSINSALDVLAVRTRREKALREGEAEERAAMEQTYPGLTGRRS
jgi:hypothetical protein